MENQELDNALRKKVTEFTEHPSPDAWDAVDGEISKLEERKTKRKLFFYKWVAGFLLLITSSLVVFISTGRFGQKSEKAGKPTESQPISHSVNSESGNLPNFDDEKNSPSPENNLENLSTKKNVQIPGNYPVENSSSTANNTPAPNIGVTGKKMKPNNPRMHDILNLDSKSESENIETSKFFNSTSISVTDSTKIILANIPDKDISSEIATVRANSVSATVLNTSSQNDSSKSKMQTDTFLTQITSENVPLRDSILPPPIKEGRWSLGIKASPLLTAVIKKGDSYSPANVTNTYSNGKNLKYGYGVMAGVRVGYDVSERLSITASADYYGRFFIASFKKIYVQKNPQNQYHTFATNSGSVRINKSEFTPFFDMHPGADSLQMSVTVNSTIHFIHLPVSANYCIIKKNRMGVYLIGGLDASYFLKRNYYSTIVDEQTGESKKRPMPSVASYEPFTFGYLAGIGASYGFKTFTASFEPTFNASITPFMSNSYTGNSVYPYSYGLTFILKRDI